MLLLTRLCCVLSLVIASTASAVTMEWVPVGNPGNPGDPQESCSFCGSGTTFGSVPYTYLISKNEVTNAQYAEFLNAVAITDTNGLYYEYSTSYGGGITRIGFSGSYSYAPITGRENMPVNNVSFLDALRFANWLQNGQPTGAQTAATTEDGAYSMSVFNPGTRNPGATIVLTSENEWYKAAYYDPTTLSYFDYPTGSNAGTTCAAPNGASNQANCNLAVGFLPTNVGSYTGSASPYGTFDQGGNVYEWTEGSVGYARIMRGGSFGNGVGALAASWRLDDSPLAEYGNLGFRLVMIPEPSTGLLVVAGLLGLAMRRTVRH